MSDSPADKSASPVKRGTLRVPLPQLERILRERGSSGSRLMGELGYAKQLWSQNQEKGWPHPTALRVAEHLGVPLATLTTAGVPAASVGPDVRALLEHIDVARPYQELQAIIDTAVDRAVREIAVAVAGLVSAGTVDGRAVVSQHRAVPVTPPGVADLEPHSRRDALRQLAESHATVGPAAATAPPRAAGGTRRRKA